MQEFHVSRETDDLGGDFHQNKRRRSRSEGRPLNLELLGLIDDNYCLTSLNYKLRNNLRCIREATFAECAKVLKNIISFCESKTPGCRQSKGISAQCKASRKGAGCGGGGCGGGRACGKPSCPVRSCQPPAPKPPCSRGRSATRKAVCSKVCPEPCVRPCARILGELAFQLERRILDYVFGLDSCNRHRFYGYTVSNICFMMLKESTCPNGEKDAIGRSDMTQRLQKVLCALGEFGYNIKYHADFAQKMVNKYGLLPCAPDPCTVQMFGLHDTCAVSCLISRLAQGPSEVRDFNILLYCLDYLAKCDCRPLMVW